ncbi:MAG: S8 family peptidase [Actinomycetota bacterium]
MKGIVAWERRSALFVATVLAAVTMAVPLSIQGATHAHIDPALLGLHGRVHVIVQTSDPSSVRSAVRQAGGTVTKDLPIAHAIAATVPSEGIDSLASLPSVSTVSLDARVHVLGSPDPSKLRSVYPKAVNADKAWSSGYTGAGITVALIETGIANVPDLAGRVKTVTTDALGLQTAPCMNFSGEDNCNDSYGHGTFVAGIIGGNGYSSSGAYTGIAPNVDFVSVKIAGANGAADVSNVLAAIQWVVSFKDAYGIKVLNLSLGTDGTQSYQTDPFDYAVERAWQAGIAVVVSAGNFGPTPQTISKPADDPFVITVGAVDDKGTQGLGDDELPNFTSRGPTAADGLTKPDVVAPGAHLASLRAPGSAVDANFPNVIDANYRRGSGTSFSAGVVSGSVALLLQAHPTWSPDRIKYALMSTAHNVASIYPNDVGSGEIDVQGALSAPAGMANQGVTPGNGMGSLDLSRGSVQVVENDPAGTLLSGALTAQLLLFSNLEYVTTTWTPLSWYTSQFYGSGWYGSGWYEDGSGWYGSGWYGSGWYGQPGGSGWYGSGWYGSGWYGVWD